MCVLLYKPKGVNLPDRDIITACHLANPHGSGFASETDYFKSLSFSQFYKRLQRVSKDENCLIHFRLATHGSICRANCHPFQLGGITFAHNGILDIKPDGDMTDSETGFRKYIYPVAAKYGINSDETAYAVNQIIGYSRFALMQGDDVRLFGNFAQFEGVYYSNGRFIDYLPY